MKQKMAAVPVQLCQVGDAQYPCQKRNPCKDGMRFHCFGMNLFILVRIGIWVLSSFQAKRQPML